RGVCRFVRAANFSDKDRFKYFEEANKNYTILQLEGTEAIQNLEEIIQVPGIDIVFIGPYDLSQSLGVPGQVTHKLVIEKMTAIIDTCLEKNIVVGIFTDQLESERYWKRMGDKYISFS